MHPVYQRHLKVLHLCEVILLHGYEMDTTQILFSQIF